MSTVDKNVLYKIRFHARGGQGGVTAAQLCVDAFGGLGMCQPRFGAERMGSPTESFASLTYSEALIRSNEQVYSPQYVGVLDDTLLTEVNVTAGLSPGGWLIVNTQKSLDELKQIVKRTDINYARLDATCLALEYLGRNVTNTVILGAIVKISPLFTVDELSSAIMKTFRAALAAKNVEVVKKAVEATETSECDIKLDFNYDGKEQWSHSDLGLPGAMDLDIAGVWYTPGGSSVVKTGTWAVTTADFNGAKCINCHKCVFICPDFSILRELDEKGQWKVVGVDKYHCKGCMNCVGVCPTKAIFDPLNACEDPIPAKKEGAK